MLNKRDALKRLFGMAAAPAVLSKDDLKSILASGGRTEFGLGSATVVGDIAFEQPPHIQRARDALSDIVSVHERRRNAGIAATRGIRPEIASKRSWSPVFKAHCIAEDDAEFQALMQHRWSDEFLDRAADFLGVKE